MCGSQHSDKAADPGAVDAPDTPHLPSTSDAKVAGLESGLGWREDFLMSDGQQGCQMKWHKGRCRIYAMTSFQGKL